MIESEELPERLQLKAEALLNRRRARSSVVGAGNLEQMQDDRAADEDKDVKFLTEILSVDHKDTIEDVRRKFREAKYPEYKSMKWDVAGYDFTLPLSKVVLDKKDIVGYFEHGGEGKCLNLEHIPLLVVRSLANLEMTRVRVGGGFVNKVKDPITGTMLEIERYRKRYPMEARYLELKITNLDASAAKIQALERQRQAMKTYEEMKKKKEEEDAIKLKEQLLEEELNKTKREEEEAKRRKKLELELKEKEEKEKLELAEKEEREKLELKEKEEQEKLMSAEKAKELENEKLKLQKEAEDEDRKKKEEELKIETEKQIQIANEKKKRENEENEKLLIIKRKQEREERGFAEQEEAAQVLARERIAADDDLNEEEKEKLEVLEVFKVSNYNGENPDVRISPRLIYNESIEGRVLVPCDTLTIEGKTRKKINCSWCGVPAVFVAPYRGAFGLCNACSKKGHGITADTTRKMITFNQQILFPGADAHILPESLPCVDLLAKCLFDNPLPVQIEGHTSTDPNEKVEWSFMGSDDKRYTGLSKKLSELRCDAVCNRIVETAKKIALENPNNHQNPEQLRTFLFPIGVGGQRHLPGTGYYDAINRRVEVHFLDLND